MLCTLGLLLGGSALLPCQEAAARYRFTIEDPAQEIVACRLRLDGLEEAIELHMPRSNAFVQLEEPRLDGEVELVPSTEEPDPSSSRPASASGDGIQLERLGPFEWRLDPGLAKAAELHWRVRLDHRRLPQIAGIDEYEWPYLDADHGLLTMGTMVIVPRNFSPARFEVRFELPAGWPVWAPWEKIDHGAYSPASSEALQDDLIAIGNWDAHIEQAGGMELTVAFAPGQSRLRRAVLDRIAPIVAAELELFGCVPQERYTFLFVKPTPGGFGGSPRINTMTLFVADDLPVEFVVEGVEHLIAHEFHHTWGRARLPFPDELRFFAEGFTDYYAHLVPWRLGYRNDDWLRGKWAEQCARYEPNHRACGLSLLAAGGDVFFEGGAAYQAVYAGGLCLALLTDLAIRKRDPMRNLDQLMRELHEDPRWRRDESITVEDLHRVIADYAGSEYANRFRVWLQAEQPIDLMAEMAKLELELKREERAAPLGFRANLAGTELLGIDPADAVAQVGLRSGDRLLEINGQTVGNEREIHLAWRAPIDGRIRVRFLRPETPEPLTIDVPIPRQVIYQVPEQLIARLRD